jgi:hypothetical protein
MTTFIKKRNQWEGCGSRWTCSIEEMEASSHGWWKFFAIMGRNGPLKTVFNHQKQVLELLEQEGIEIDYFIEIPDGLQSVAWQEGGMRYLQGQIDDLEKKEAKGRKGTKASYWRLSRIANYREQLKNLKSIK